MSDPVTNVAALGGSLPPARTEGGIVPAMVVYPQVQGDMPHDGQLDPDLKLRGMSLPRDAQGETRAQRRGRSCVGRFLSCLGQAVTGGWHKSGKEVPLEESWATSVGSPAQQPTTRCKQQTQMRSKRHVATEQRRQGRSVGHVHRRKIVPEGVCHDDWRVGFERKLNEATEKKGCEVHSVKKLESMTWDSILESHARNRRQLELQQRFHEATETQDSGVVSVKKLSSMTWDSILENHARNRRQLDFQQRFHEATESQDSGVLSIKKLERKTWDSILESHAR